MTPLELWSILALQVLGTGAVAVALLRLLTVTRRLEAAVGRLEVATTALLDTARRTAA